MPEASEIMRRGFLWVAEGKAVANQEQLATVAGKARSYTGMGDSQ